MDVVKFKKICGMLGSDHDGERANAARMATSLLKQGGLSWDAIGVGSPAASYDPYGSRHELHYYRMMLDDERGKNDRLTKEVAALKRAVKTLELKLVEQASGVPVAEQRKAEKAEKTARKEERLAQQQREAAESAAARAANPRAEMPGDQELRDAIEHALTQTLPERTREFLASVKDQKMWSLRQREALRKTLQWLFRAKGET